MADRIYLLLNTDGVPVAKGRLLSGANGDIIEVRVLEDRIDDVAGLTVVQLVGMTMDMPSLQGSVLRCVRDVLVLQRIESMADIREVLRVDVNFDTLIYPLRCTWKGRRKVQSIDLSCGGIAFYCDDMEETMERGDVIEIVIPVTPQPLLLHAQILRSRPAQGQMFYAAKFVDMCHEEEMLVCEAVFGIQLKQYKQPGQ